MIIIIRMYDYYAMMIHIATCCEQIYFTQLCVGAVTNKLPLIIPIKYFI